MEGPDGLASPPDVSPQLEEQVKQEEEQIVEKEEMINVNFKQGEGQVVKLIVEEMEGDQVETRVEQDKEEMQDLDLIDEMEGPPPGWGSLPPPPPPPPQQDEEQVKEEAENKEDTEGEQVGAPEVGVEKDDRVEVQVNLIQHEGEGIYERENLIVEQHQLAKQVGEDGEEEMECPSPGSDSLPALPQLPQEQVERTKVDVENDEEMEGKQVETLVEEEKEEREDLDFKHQQLLRDEGDGDEMEGPPPGWNSLPPSQPQLPPQKDVPGGEKEQKENLIVKEQQSLNEGVDEEMEGPPPGWDSLQPPPPQFPPQQEMGQMVCGSCRRLLSYPQGSKHVRCSCCLTVNYVLEEHQVGQVRCGKCKVLLMYLFGAQSVRCCSCCSVIPIGDHNRRPPLSVQQSRACRPFSIGH